MQDSSIISPEFTYVQFLSPPLIFLRGGLGGVMELLFTDFLPFFVVRAYTLNDSGTI
jgi:hypothetical protein